MGGADFMKLTAVATRRCFHRGLLENLLMLPASHNVVVALGWLRTPEPGATRKGPTGSSPENKYYWLLEILEATLVY
jgi:hypothetical protein